MSDQNFRHKNKTSGSGPINFLEKKLGGILERLEDTVAPLSQKQIPQTIHREKLATPGKPLNPELQLLLKLFGDFPVLAGGESIAAKQKEQLLALARKAYSSNEIKLTRMQARDHFINSLHSNMTRDFGMLGVMSNLLEASHNGEPVRWETYCSYAKRQMEELKSLEQQIKAPVSGKSPGNMQVAELVESIRKQMVHLSRQPAQSGYLPMYEQLKRLPLDGTEADLFQWYKKASAIMRKGLERVEPYLRQALEEDYPVFSLSLCDEMTGDRESNSIKPSQAEREEE